jgi:hypothetical protein
METWYNNKEKKMKKIAVAALLALSACTGIRGIEEGKKTCIHSTFLGISFEEMLKPCT